VLGTTPRAALWFADVGRSARLHDLWPARGGAPSRSRPDVRATDDVGAQIIDEYRRTGFGYRDYPGASGYGLSLSALPWVLERALDLPHCRVVLCRERACDDHQDIVALVNDAC
jgi:hypothetical protein